MATKSKPAKAKTQKKKKQGYLVFCLSWNDSLKCSFVEKTPETVKLIKTLQSAHTDDVSDILDRFVEANPRLVEGYLANDGEIVRWPYNKYDILLTVFTCGY